MPPKKIQPQPKNDKSKQNGGKTTKGSFDVAAILNPKK